ncbi:hypothetical protein, partial [Deinococcus radiopugnans]
SEQREEQGPATLDGAGTGFKEAPEIFSGMLEGLGKSRLFDPFTVNDLFGVRIIRIPIESFAKTMKFERTRVGKNTGFAYGLTHRRFPDGLRN